MPRAALLLVMLSWTIGCGDDASPAAGPGAGGDDSGSPSTGQPDGGGTPPADGSVVADATTSRDGAGPSDGERGNGTTDLPNVANNGLAKDIKNGTWDPQKRFVVLSPQMDDRNNMTERTGASVNDFVDFAKKNYQVDVKRIYLTGLSGGGAPRGAVRGQGGDLQGIRHRHWRATGVAGHGNPPQGIRRAFRGVAWQRGKIVPRLLFARLACSPWRALRAGSRSRDQVV